MKNTSKVQQSSTTNSDDFGDLGEEKEATDPAQVGTGPGPLAVIDGYIDDFKNRWVKVARGKHTAILRLAELMHEGSGMSALTKAGVVVTNKAIYRQLMKDLDAFDGYQPARVISRPGWTGNSFACGDGKIVSPTGKQGFCINALTPNPKFSKNGTLANYWRGVAPLVKNQEIPLFALGLAFVSPLLEVVEKTEMDPGNIITEAIGNDSSGKSTVFSLLLGSVHGGLNRPTGFAESWNATKGGIGKLIHAHNGYPLQLDEANLAGKSPTERSELISDTVFTVTDANIRITQASEGPVSSRLVLVSTANDPLSSYLSASQASLGALDVRVLAVHILPSRQYKALSFIPKGFSSSAAANDELKRLVKENYGAPGRLFISKLVNDRDVDEKALIQKLRKWSEKFMLAIGVNGNNASEHRKAKSLALTYAAARLARSYGALPDSKSVGNLLVAYKKVWSMGSGKNASVVSTVVKRSGRERLLAYYNLHRKQFDRAKSPRKLSDLAFNAAHGFVRKRRDKEWELILSKAAYGRFRFTRSEQNLLIADGIVLNFKGRPDCQRTVRMQKGRPKKDWVKVVHIGNLRSIRTK